MIKKLILNLMLAMILCIPTVSAADAVNILNSASLTPTMTSNAQCNQVVADVLSKITNDKMSTYQKIKACYDWLINNCSYGVSNEGLGMYDKDFSIRASSDRGMANAWEMLVGRVGVCDDYSCAFAAMVRRIGLNCYTIGGKTARATSGMTGHIWCVIKVNGTEYVFDPQIDDNIAKGGPIGYYRFCKTYAEVPGSYADMKVYNYFKPFDDSRSNETNQSEYNKNELPKFYEHCFSLGQTFNILDDENTLYYFVNPDMVENVSEEGNKKKFRLIKTGDFYILVSEPNKPKYIWCLNVDNSNKDVDLEATIKHQNITLDRKSNASDKYKIYAEKVLELVNAEREKIGLKPLRLSNELMMTANIRVEEITRMFSHTRPNGKPCTSLLDSGRYTVGENIAAGDAQPEDVVKSWMNSPGHRANIMHPIFKELGVGYSYKGDSQYKHYWVQIFKG